MATSGELITAYLIIREIVRKLPRYPDFNRQVSVSRDVVPTFAKHCKAEINIQFPRAAMRDVIGALRRYQVGPRMIGRIICAGRDDIPWCWQRYVVVKEMVHLAIDTEHRHFTSISKLHDTVSAMMAGVSNDHDSEYVGLCTEFPNLSHLDKTPEKAIAGIRALVRDVVAELVKLKKPVPQPAAS